MHVHRRVADLGTFVLIIATGCAAVETMRPEPARMVLLPELARAEAQHQGDLELSLRELRADLPDRPWVSDWSNTAFFPRQKLSQLAAARAHYGNALLNLAADVEALGESKSKTLYLVFLYEEWLLLSKGKLVGFNCCARVDTDAYREYNRDLPIMFDLAVHEMSTEFCAFPWVRGVWPDSSGSVHAFIPPEVLLAYYASLPILVPLAFVGDVVMFFTGYWWWHKVESHDVQLGPFEMSEVAVVRDRLQKLLREVTNQDLKESGDMQAWVRHRAYFGEASKDHCAEHMRDGRQE
jgi:hypothetical protein